MTLILCIEGQKGAGKSSLISALTHIIPNCKTCAPFRDIMPQIQKISPQSETTYAFSQTLAGSQVLTDMLIDFIQQQVSIATKDRTCLILDRGWITGIRTIQGMNIPETDKQIQMQKWQNFQYQTVFLDTSIDNIYQRRRDLLNIASGLSTDTLLETDMAERRKLAQGAQTPVIFLETKNLPAPEIEADIQAKIEIICSKTGGFK